MIPKIIHYVWLGGGKKSPSVKRCIDSWRKMMPEYEIREWNETNFDIDSVPWTKEAVSIGKWSLASDYIRHYAIYKYGGIYMDTDVMVYKSFDEFLKYDFFTSVEFHPQNFIPNQDIDENGLPKSGKKSVANLGLLAACFGAVPGNPFIKECLDYFGSRHYIRPDGTLDEEVINPGVMALILTKYGFRFFDRTQFLVQNMAVFKSNVFAGDSMTRDEDSYAMHFMDNSWMKKNFKWRLRSFLESYFPSILRK